MRDLMQKRYQVSDLEVVVENESEVLKVPGTDGTKVAYRLLQEGAAPDTISKYVEGLKEVSILHQDSYDPFDGLFGKVLQHPDVKEFPMESLQIQMDWVESALIFEVTAQKEDDSEYLTSLGQVWVPLVVLPITEEKIAELVESASAGFPPSYIVSPTGAVGYIERDWSDNLVVHVGASSLPGSEDLFALAVPLGKQLNSVFDGESFHSMEDLLEELLIAIWDHDNKKEDESLREEEEDEYLRGDDEVEEEEERDEEVEEAIEGMREILNVLKENDKLTGKMRKVVESTLDTLDALESLHTEEAKEALSNPVSVLLEQYAKYDEDGKHDDPKEGGHLKESDVFLDADIQAGGSSDKVLDLSHLRAWVDALLVQQQFWHPADAQPSSKERALSELATSLNQFRNDTYRLLHLPAPIRDGISSVIHAMTALQSSAHVYSFVLGDWFSKHNVKLLRPVLRALIDLKSLLDKEDEKTEEAREQLIQFLRSQTEKIRGFGKDDVAKGEVKAVKEVLESINQVRDPEEEEEEELDDALYSFFKAFAESMDIYDFNLDGLIEEPLWSVGADPHHPIEMGVSVYRKDTPVPQEKLSSQESSVPVPQEEESSPQESSGFGTIVGVVAAIAAVAGFSSVVTAGTKSREPKSRVVVDTTLVEEESEEKSARLEGRS